MFKTELKPTKFCSSNSGSSTREVYDRIVKRSCMLLIKQVCVCTVISECWISARAANHRTCSSRTFIIAMRYCNLLFYCTPSGTPNFRWKLCNCALDGSSNSIISYACHLLLILKLAYFYSDGSFNSSHWIFYRTSSCKFSDTENPMNQTCQCKNPAGKCFSSILTAS